MARDFQAKGGDIVLEIFKRLRRHRPNLMLTVAGSPQADPGITGVTWLGPTDRDHLYRSIYPQADLFVYPTRFDCAPLVVMEALAHGLPVLAPRAFAIPELVLAGVTGLLHTPGDVAGAAADVEALLSDPTTRKLMGDAARADFRERFSIEHRNQILAAIYRGLVQ